MVSKEAVGQVHFHVTKYVITDYIALNLPYFTSLVSFVILLVKERDHKLSPSVLTIRKTGISMTLWCKGAIPEQELPIVLVQCGRRETPCLFCSIYFKIPLPDRLGAGK